MPDRRRAAGRSPVARVLIGLLALVGFGLALTPADPVEAATPPTIPVPTPPVAPTIPVPPAPEETSPGSGPRFELPANIPAVDLAPATPRPSGDDPGDGDGGADATIGLSIPDVEDGASNVVVVILLLSVLSIAPSILILTTSFTRIVIVMSLTRNALGIPQLPPQQVIVGLSLFLTLFVMGPTLQEMNDVALQPLLDNELSVSEAADAASEPLREFMLRYTREPELELFLDAADTTTPVARDEVPLTALVPAFVLSELKSAFILGFIVFVPFMVIDLVVSAVLTSLGMMMLPPTFVSLPMKLLLFVLLDGWSLVVGTLLTSYR